MKETDSLSIEELKQMSEKMYDGLVKAVVDVKQGIMVVDASMHVDEEQYLLESGSSQYDLWGINLYPDEFDSEAFVEFDSMINLRPGQGNRTRSVDDETTRTAILNIVRRIVHE